MPYESIRLTSSFRNGQQVADVERATLNLVETNAEIYGLGYNTEIHKAIDYTHGYHMMVIARTNAQLLEVLFHLMG